VPASSKTSPTELSTLTGGYSLCARAEGKTPKTICTVTSSVSYLERYLRSEGWPTDVRAIGPIEIRAFILYLKNKKRFSHHPFATPQQDGLSEHSINCYLRSVRAFWSWLTSEGISGETPFAKVKIPKAPRKVIPTFSDAQLLVLLGAVDTCTPEGYRDYAIILTLLDTGLRVSELTGVRLEDLRLEDGVLKVMGKGGKERLIPIGKGVQRMLWKYINRFRLDPANPNCDFLFLTADGWPIWVFHAPRSWQVWKEPG